MTSHVQFSFTNNVCLLEIFDSLLSLKVAPKTVFEAFIFHFNNKISTLSLSLSKGALLLSVLLKKVSPTTSDENSLLLMKEVLEMPTFDADSEAPATCCKSCCLKGIMCSFK